MEQDAPQDVYAEEHVARALSLAATILEASPRGLTKAEIWERIELYPREVSTAEEKEAREKVFDRDKKYLSQNGIRLIRSEAPPSMSTAMRSTRRTMASPSWS